MRLEKTVYRKGLPSWYDSSLLCLVQILVMGGVFLFGLAGISVARQIPGYHGHLWVPLVLVVLSGTVIISTTIRMFLRRYFGRVSH